MKSFHVAEASSTARSSGVPWGTVLFVVVAVAIGIAVVVLVYAHNQATSAQWSDATAVMVRFEMDDAQALLAERHRLEARKAVGHRWSETDEQNLALIRAEVEQRDALFSAMRATHSTVAADVVVGRLKEIGVEAQASVEGEGKIRVLVPRDVEIGAEVRAVLETPGKLLFRMEANRNDPLLQAVEYPANPDPIRYRWLPAPESSQSPWSLGHPFDSDDMPESARDPEFAELWERDVKWILVDMNPLDDPRVNGSDLNSVYPTKGADGDWEIGFSLNARAASAFARLTRRHAAPNYANQLHTPRLCIIVDRRIHWCGVINAEITGTAVMTGFDSLSEVRQMIALLRAGELPGKLIIDDIR